MGFPAGFLRDRIQVLRRVIPEGSKYGKSGGKPTYEVVACLWGNVTWTKGVKAMREGALDAYDTVMVRTSYTCQLTRDSFIGHEGRIYQIHSFNASLVDNTIQITAIEIVK
jgi:head-tail adaptor